MNPSINYYRGTSGSQAFGKVTVKGVPAAGATVTIGGTAFTYGTTFWGDNPNKIAASLTAAICADRATYGSLHAATQVIRDFFAVFLGPIVEVIACAPGSGGNSITLATSDSTNFVLSGATLVAGA